MSVIPLLTAILFIYYKICVGEYSLGGFFDPGYAYLFNSLNLSQLKGYGVGHVDHPGTTVQSAGAIVIRLVYWISPLKENVAEDLIYRPEHYVSAIAYFFVCFTAVCSFILGLVVYRKMKNIYVSVVMQLIPLYSATIYDHLADLSSESFLIPSVLLILAVTFSFVSGGKFSRKKILFFVLLFSSVSGFGLASKITFFPLMVIPVFLIWRNGRYRDVFYYIAGTAVFTFIFVLPAISYGNTEYFTEWIKNITLHSGQYGTGPKYVIHGESFMTNLVNIFSYEMHFVLIYFSMFVFVILQFMPKFRSRLKENKYCILLNAIFISTTIYIIIISKHFEYHYLIPAYMLCLPALVCIFFISADLMSSELRKRLTGVVAALLIIHVILMQIHLFREFGDHLRIQAEAKKLDEFRMKNFKGVQLIDGRLKTKEFAMIFGIAFSGKGDIYKPIFLKNYPEYIYFDKYLKEFGKLGSENLEKVLEHNSKILFSSDDPEMINSFTEKLNLLIAPAKVSPREVFRNGNNEFLYELTLIK